MARNGAWDHLSIERATYGTVVLMSILVVYQGWSQLTFLGTAAVIIAPVLALLLAHYFADAMAMHIQLERPLRRQEWSGLVRRQVGLALAAVPPLTIIALGWVTPMDALSTIELLLWTGVLTLVLLAVVAARRAGYTGWRVPVAGGIGGLVGILVVSLQILLKPY